MTHLSSSGSRIINIIFIKNKKKIILFAVFIRFYNTLYVNEIIILLDKHAL